jgi:hypothetical protein
MPRYTQVHPSIASAEHYEYFSSCARIRGIGIGVLVARLLKEIAEGQLVLAILDDGSRRHRNKYETHYPATGDSE